jgi:DNA-binding PadR family transcriptional regulator
MAKRGEALELAVLGLLHGSPLHGYELRKQLTGVLGWGRVLSFGSLYPCLKALVRKGYIVEQETALDQEVRPSRRARIVYALTADGKERFDTLVSAAGPSAWDDDNFGVHFAFFGAATTETRLRILEGRRTRLEERVDGVRVALARSRERVDSYTLELQRHGLESVEREVRWLNELITNERAGHAPAGDPQAPQQHPSPSVGDTAADSRTDRSSNN